MGRMMTVKVLRQLIQEWALPEEMDVSWSIDDAGSILDAEKTFLRYVADGWIAFSDTPQGRRRIFHFDPTLELIMLMPPLGGG